MSEVALVYVRKSVVRYEEDRASPKRQLENCARVCQGKGWPYEVYEDAEGNGRGCASVAYSRHLTTVCVYGLL